MQAAQTPLSLQNGSWARSLRWFLLPPITALVLVILLVAGITATYQQQHAGRVYSGVQVWNADLSGMTREEAAATLTQIIPDAADKTITLADPVTGQQWTRTSSALGITYDVEETVDAAFSFGREGGPLRALRQQFAGWYYGYRMAPIIIFDEGQLQSGLKEIAGEINRPALNATLQFDGQTLAYTPGQVGRQLDIADAQQRLSQPLLDFREAEVELLVHQVRPQVLDDTETAAQVQSFLSSPMTLYFQEPLEDLDLEQVVVPTEKLAEWLRVEMVDGEEGAHYQVFMDQQPVRQWLTELEAQVYRAPQNARFYFDDNTQELVLVEPHINGRALNVEATLNRFMEQVGTSDRSLAFVVDDIRPTVHSNVTAAELGITELVTESTTWFYGSSPERKHNIARAAAQFFGLVIAPGEEFSFNHYLGDVTEDAGFTTGLIILNGQTVEGVGGGVCQVSTTMFQTAFWAGFPITARLEHGYRVHYYDDGEGAGMDATVFSPLVDLRFINNTDHYLLIENYYNETYESLTFKFYSTRVGRVVEKAEYRYENVVPPTEPVWIYDEDLEEGEIKKIDWAAEGADVTIVRHVKDLDGNLLYEQTFESHYIPWHDSYHYGPGVDPDNVSPSDIPNE